MLTTRQEIFDHVYKALKSQGFKQSLEDPHNGDCMYFSPNGMHRCAAGWLMNPEVFQKAQDGHGSLEFKDIGDVIHDIEACEVKGLFNFDHKDEGIVSFVKRLQAAHDNGHTPILMINLLLKVAGLSNLTVPQ